MASVPEDPSAVDSSITLVAPAPATIQDAETPKFDQVSVNQLPL
jgi:hypothetical protein